MTKVLLLSDTHSHIDDVMIKYAKEVDEIWHAGDIGNLNVTDVLKSIKPLRAVYGNIDNDQARREFPLDNRFICDGVDVWITHIAGYPNKYHSRILSELKKNPPKILVCGHSHILKVQFDKKFNCLFLNPGAIGTYGIHKVRTMLRFELDNGNIKNMEVIELQRELKK